MRLRCMYRPSQLPRWQSKYRLLNYYEKLNDPAVRARKLRNARIGHRMGDQKLIISSSSSIERQVKPLVLDALQSLAPTIPHWDSMIYGRFPLLIFLKKAWSIKLMIMMKVLCVFQRFVVRVRAGARRDVRVTRPTRLTLVLLCPRISHCNLRSPH
jgi:hypothetical protein